MSLKRINPAGLSGAAPARASWAVVHNGVAYLSGATGRDPTTGRPVTGGIVQQTRQAMNNIEVILEEAGSSLTKVIKTSCYLSTLDDFTEFTEVWESYFQKEPPARVCTQAGLKPGLLIEIEVIAAVG